MFDAPSTHTAPRCRPQPRGLPRRALPARCGLAAGSPTAPSRMHFAGIGLLFLFLFFAGVGARYWALAASCGLRCLCSEIRRKNLRGGRGGGLLYQKPVSCFPRHPFIPFSTPYIWRSSTPYVLPHIHLQGSPKPQEEPRTGEVQGAIGSDVPNPTTSLAFPSSSPGPGAETQPRFEGLGWGGGGDPCCETPNPI